MAQSSVVPPSNFDRLDEIGEMMPKNKAQTFGSALCFRGEFYADLLLCREVVLLDI